jgi:hypothetical protein
VFRVSPARGDTSTVFQVNASDSADDSDVPEFLQVRWDWEGDGHWDTPWSSSLEAEHRYGSPGEYTIRLEVRDSEGLTSSVGLTVSVGAPPLPPFLAEGVLIAVAATAAGVAGYWLHLRWRRGWFRRARNRERARHR